MLRADRTSTVGFPLLEDPEAAAAWGRSVGLADPTLATRVLTEFAENGITFDLIASMVQKLGTLLPAVSDPDRVLAALGRFIASVRSPLSTPTLFERDPDSLGVLLSLFSASPYLADAVITDPEAWEDVRLGRGRPESRDSLAAMLAAEIGGSDEEAARAAWHGHR